MDAVALAATIGGFSVAGWTAWLQRKSARELAELKNEHDRTLARGQRLFDRRAAAYEAMIGYLQVHWERILNTEPIFREGGGPEPPAEPTPDEWRPM